VDYEEFVLRRDGSDPEGDVVFKGARCYGFRNLQNVVRKVGRESGVRVGMGAAGRMKGKAAVQKRGTRGQDKAVEKGYDYIEVMACPGGCVNGGGQSKPPGNFGIDVEGFSRDWEVTGVTLDHAPEALTAKWGNKAWTKKVEDMYWHDLPTPPASPVLAGENHMTQKEDAGKDSEIRNKMADRLLIDITDDFCRKPGSGSHLFRTSYRAVESEVVGLAVKW